MGWDWIKEAYFRDYERGRWAVAGKTFSVN